MPDPVLDIISNDYNLIHQWHFISRPTIVRLQVLIVVLPKVQVCWVVTITLPRILFMEA